MQRVNEVKIFFCLFEISFFLANDLAIENNRYISSLHCTFEFHNGHVFIRDTSSNGTLINRTKKINKNETVKFCFSFFEKIYLGNI